MRRLSFIAAAILVLSILPANAQQQYDPGGKARVSNYCKTTTTGDTPCPTSPTISTITTITNPVTVVQPTGTNLHAVIDSGTVSLPSGASTSALQSNVQAAATASTPAVVNFVEPVDVTGAQPNFATAVPVIMSDPYPSGSTAVSCSTGNVAAATATCTIPAASNKTTYITGFDITGSGATVGSVVTCTLTNTGSGTHSYTFAATAGALLSDTPLVKSFATPLKATAQNTSPVLSCPSLGTGNTNMTINADGYEL